MSDSKSRVKDLTVGSPMKLILGFALPLLGGMLFQQFYSLVDTLIVGQFLGVKALAGVGSTGSINFMIIGFCMGVTNGFAIPIAQEFGAKEYSNMRKYFAGAIYLSIVFAIVMTIVVSVFCRDILIAMQTPKDVMDYAYTYILVIFLGIPATYLYNLCSGAIRALGDSKAPVVFLIISSVVNIALDLIFIINFSMGVFGAALATVVSQLFSGILSVIYIMEKVDVLRVRRDEWKGVNKLIIGNLCKMGIPMGLQYSITAIGSVILQTAVNSLGSTYVAAMTAGSRVLMFFSSPFDALGSTMATYGGQNVGAAKPERFNPGMKSACLLGIGYSLIAFVVLYFAGSSLTGLFLEAGTKSRDVVMNLGWEYLVVNSVFYTALVFVNVVRFMIQGMGYSMLAILAGVMEMIGRSLVAFIFVPKYGFIAACFASPIAWIFADFFLWPCYFHVRKKIIRMLGRS